MILNETVGDTLISYIILKKLVKPFEEWDAYKYGIIDADGKKIRSPKNSIERASWTSLDRMIANIKKLLIKVLGKSKLASYFTAAYLLKDNVAVILNSNQQLFESYIKETEFTYQEQNIIYKAMKNFPIKEYYLSYVVEDKKFITLFMKYEKDVENFLNENKEFFELIMNKLNNRDLSDDSYI